MPLCLDEYLDIPLDFLVTLLILYHTSLKFFELLTQLEAKSNQSHSNVVLGLNCKGQQVELLDKFISILQSFPDYRHTDQQLRTEEVFVTTLVPHLLKNVQGATRGLLRLLCHVAHRP